MVFYSEDETYFGVAVMRLLVLTAGVLGYLSLAQAQAPGVDPIQVKSFSAPKLRGGPTGPRGPAIKGRDGVYDTPSSRAKMARFTAKIMTLTRDDSDSQGFATNATVTAVQDSQTRTCVMDIGSVTAPSSGFSRFGPAGESAQPVLIRGNVINVCR